MSVEGSPPSDESGPSLPETPSTLTDYEFPNWFWDTDTTDEERNHWFNQWRCFKQAMRQETPYAHAMQKHIERNTRISKARDSTVDLKNYR